MEVSQGHRRCSSSLALDIRHAPSSSPSVVSSFAEGQKEKKYLKRKKKKKSRSHKAENRLSIKHEGLISQKINVESTESS